MHPHHFLKISRFNEMIGYEWPADHGIAALDQDTAESIRIMLTEELGETLEALDAGNDTLFCDGLADLCVVALGAFHKMGINGDVVLDSVNRSNLTKDPADVGRGFPRDAGRGVNYESPDFALSDDLFRRPDDRTQEVLERADEAIRSTLPPEDRSDDAAKETLRRLNEVLDPDARPQTLVIEDDPNHFVGHHRRVEVTRVEEKDLDVPYPLREAAALRATKGRDYMSGGVTRADLNPFGLLSYVHNVVHKVLRLRSIVQVQVDCEDRPNHESLRDNALDAINYLSFLVEFLDGRAVDR